MTEQTADYIVGIYACGERKYTQLEEKHYKGNKDQEVNGYQSFKVDGRQVCYHSSLDKNALIPMTQEEFVMFDNYMRCKYWEQFGKKSLWQRVKAWFK